MDSKREKQIITDWLNSAKRQVRQTNNNTSVFISFNFNATVDKMWEAWTDPTKLGSWFATVVGEIKEGDEIAFDVGAPFNITSKILKLTPQHLLRFTWFYPEKVVDELKSVFYKVEILQPLNWSNTLQTSQTGGMGLGLVGNLH